MPPDLWTSGEPVHSRQNGQVSPLLLHQATRLVETSGEPADVYAAVQAAAARGGRIVRSTPTQHSLLLRVRRRLGSVQVGVHVQPGRQPGLVTIEIVTMAGGATDTAAVAVADRVADLLRAALRG